MKKLILAAAWIFIRVTAFAQTATQKPTTSVSNFADANTIFMVIGIVLVAAFVLIPVYSMSRAVSVLAKKASENIK